MATKPMRPKVGLEWIKVGDMTPNHTYQRDRQPVTIKKLTDGWDDARIGACIVNKITDATGKVTEIRLDDGGHRWEVALAMFGEKYELPCVVNENLDALQESGVFLGVNRDRKAVAKWDEYHVAVDGGHEPYVSIETMLNKYQLGAAQKASANRIGAVQALVRSEANFGIKALETAIVALEGAYGRSKATWDADMIQALARLAGKKKGGLDLQRLINTVAKQPVHVWRNKALNGPGGSESRSIKIAKIIATAYNTRLPAAQKVAA